jgi:hypothetical protein
MIKKCVCVCTYVHSSVREILGGKKKYSRMTCSMQAGDRPGK